MKPHLDKCPSEDDHILREQTHSIEKFRGCREYNLIEKRKLSGVNGIGSKYLTINIIVQLSY